MTKHLEPAGTSSATVEAFIKKWSSSGGAERSNYALFITELCDVLGVPHPDPSREDNRENAYVIDRSIVRKKPDGTTSTVFADCYKRGCFMMETKQGSSAKSENAGQLALIDAGEEPLKQGHGKRGTRQWDIMLDRAYNQAYGYIRDLPAQEGRPPFLIVCDVGYVLELYSEFTCTGGNYVRFPGPKNHRIYLEDLREDGIRERLRSVWTNPHALDPSKYAAKVTREVAWHLSELAKTLDGKHDPQIIATFLQRCLFTMFAEDVGLLPGDGFVKLLEMSRKNPAGFVPLVTQLWKDMANGADYSTVLMQKIAHFNGGLFDSPSALPLDAAQISMLIGAAKKDWSEVEPAIFGTLLERALNPRDRHKLGAHYTPRSYVERLVKPTIVDPLRRQFNAAKAAAIQLRQAGKEKEAIEQLRAFHRELCGIRVLDPACGSGNFLYVTLEHMKRLEGEVLELLESLGDTELSFEMEQFRVRPQQFWGLEINAQAVAIAQLVIWIGYFQWQKRTTGDADTRDRPLLPKERTICHQDAVLAYDKREFRKDADGKFVTIWDGHTTKPHPVTGREVPDESARIPLYDYTNPRRAEWPAADFIVGNPPFIGARTNREALGDGYLYALRKVHPSLPANIDFVMYWWHHAAELLENGKIRSFGFITSNSFTQSFNQQVVIRILSKQGSKLKFSYAIPDHPWVDSTDGAQVRISIASMNNAGGEGILATVTDESERDEYGEIKVVLSEVVGCIQPSLILGAELGNIVPLSSNERVSCVGYQLTGDGFTLNKKASFELDVCRPLLSAKDLTQQSRKLFAVDVCSFSEDFLKKNAPSVYQYLVVNVKPIRDVNSRKTVRNRWWVYGEPRFTFRPALKDIKRMIVTPLTSKHRFFTFCDSGVIADSTTVIFSFNDACILGVLSSAVHVNWALKQGGTLEDRPRYNKTRCFETFPFPDMQGKKALEKWIRELGERLDAHRKAQQAAHPELTMTGMYNVLEKLRAGETLTEKERRIHEAGLVSVLKQLHDDIDAAVLEAYGWDDLAEDPTPLADRLARGDAAAEALKQQLLTRLVALNHVRAEEEKGGRVRWLRPDYQNPAGEDTTKTGKQAELDVDTAADAATEKLDWPDTLAEQFAAVKLAIETVGADALALAGCFGRRTKKRVEEINGILQTLRSLGQL